MDICSAVRMTKNWPCFIYRFETASPSPTPNKRVYGIKTRHTVVLPMANPTNIWESEAQGLCEREASKRQLSLVGVNRTIFHQFHMILFGGYLHFQPFVIMRVLEHLVLILMSEMGINTPIVLLPGLYNIIYFQYTLF